MRVEPGAPRAIGAAPTTPPAGPESTVRTGSRRRSRAPTRPPFDCITRTPPRHDGCRRAQTCSVMSGPTYAFTTVVETRSYSRYSRRSRCDAVTWSRAVRARARAAPRGAARGTRAGSRSRPRPARARPTARRRARPRARASGVSIASVDEHALDDAEAAGARHERRRQHRHQVVEPRPHLAADREHVLEAGRRDERDARAAPLRAARSSRPSSRSAAASSRSAPTAASARDDGAGSDRAASSGPCGRRAVRRRPRRGR